MANSLLKLSFWFIEKNAIVTRLVRKIKLVMIMENGYVKMVMKDKIAVHVCMDFTRKGSIEFNLYVQVSLLCVSLVLLQLKPNLLH